MTETRRRVAIVTDTAASIPPEICARYDIQVIPIYIIFGTQTYRSGIDIDIDTFYRLMDENKQLPTTSQPTVDDFCQLYTQLAGQAETIISIHPSKKISATVDAAQAASQLVDIPVHVIDSKSITIGIGMTVIAAARAAQAGQNAAQIVEMTHDLIEQMNLICTVDTLEYLHRGGRIGGAAALFGSMMKIKPILHLEDGQVEPLEKPRTRKRAIDRVLTLMAERVGANRSVHVAVLHCHAPQDAQALYDQVKLEFECAELFTVEAGPSIGTHAGPGTVGVAFYAS